MRTGSGEPAGATGRVRAGSLKAWAAAMRPRSLPVAISPVMVGAALGWARTGALDWLALVLIAGAALLMQLITNLQNDVGYTVRGAESGRTRTGLPRATANGWLRVGHVQLGIVAACVMAIALGLALVAWRGWPVLLIGTACMLAALAYMGGPWPIAYTPLGELTVFIFFGLVAVMGTDWVLSGSIGRSSALASLAIGALAAAALAVNNHRDIAHDRLVGRHTFAVSFGGGASLRLFTLLVVAAFALTPLISLSEGHAAVLLPLALLPSAWRLRTDFARCDPGLAFNQILFRSFALELRFAGLLAAGAVLGRTLGI